MKRIMLVFSMLVLLSLACTALSGGGDDTLVTPGSNPAGTAGESSDNPTDSGDVEPVGSGSMGAGTACYNPFYPLNAGVVLTYRATTSGDFGALPPAEYQLVVVEETGDTITVQMVFDEVSSEVKWLCGEEGLFSSEYAQFNFAELGDQLAIETVSYEGITLPTEDAWYPGSTWDMNYEINMSYEVDGIAVTSHVIGQMTYEVIGTESVSVPAGTYPEAYKVETTGTLTIETDILGTSSASDIDLDMTTWYVKDIGMVRQESTDIMGGSLIELIAID